MTAPSRHQDWSDFAALIGSRHPALVMVPGSPQTVFFSDTAGSRIGLRVVWSGDAPSLRLNEITTATVALEGERYLEISTRKAAIYQEFYAFCCSLADRIQLNGESPLKALSDSIRSWSSLFTQMSVLSVAGQAGLYGELWVLLRLASVIGWAPALDAWKGADAAEHDFSLEQKDIEVKTTTQERRIHTIQSATQLEASPTRPLFMLSLQLTAGGLAGNTLAAAVAEVRAAVPRQLLDSLEAKLRQSGWHPEHDSFYDTRFLHRASPVLIAVDDRFPRISSGSLASLEPSVRARVSNLSYDINVDGLGVEDGSPEFLHLLPARTEN